MDIFEYVQQKLSLEYISDIRVHCKHSPDILPDLIQELSEKYSDEEVNKVKEYVQIATDD